MGVGGSCNESPCHSIVLPGASKMPGTATHGHLVRVDVPFILSESTVLWPVLSAGVFPSCVTDFCNAVISKDTLLLLISLSVVGDPHMGLWFMQ